MKEPKLGIRQNKETNVIFCYKGLFVNVQYYKKKYFSTLFLKIELHLI